MVTSHVNGPLYLATFSLHLTLLQTASLHCAAVREVFQLPCFDKFHTWSYIS